MNITNIKAREILASGGEPSVEVKVTLESGVVGLASVSYGASAGSKEAFILLDNDKSRYNGKGMLKAVANVNEKLAPLLAGKNASNQRALDGIMISADNTENKSNLGANAILGVSMAIARAGAVSEGLELYQYLQKSYNISPTYDKEQKPRLPKPMVVLIEGGKHADNSTDLQEYLLTVIKDHGAAENVRMAREIYQQ
jgi:enolase